jgi:hypothetical protein
MENTRFIGFVAALALLFASCDNKNELPNNELSGKDVTVRIRSMSVTSGGSESLGRSSSQREPEVVTTLIGDGMLLEMSIKEDESPLRSPVELATGTHFRVIAVTGTSDYYSHGDYVYGSGIPLTPSPSTDFHVKVGQIYSFICISYNSASLPPSTGYTVGSPLPTSFNVSNTRDLLLWRSSSTTISSAGIDLDITLTQMLAKVKVIVDCDYNKWKITSVTANKITIGEVSPSYTLNWSNRTITGPGTGEYQGFTYSTIVPNSTSQTSGELRVVPKGSGTVTVKLLAGAISRNGFATAVPSGERSATFTTPLSAGVSYTVTTRLRVPIFARSNIYWHSTGGNSGYLTFVPAAIPPDHNDDTKQGYQGVLFKYGSLVGISPAQKSGANETQKNAFDGTVPVYIPTYDGYTPANSTWVRSDNHGYTVAGWPVTSSGVSENGTANIPYLDGSYSGPGTVAYGRNNRFAIDADRNTNAMYEERRGDICQYLGKTQSALAGYRLPTSNEFGSESEIVWNASAPNANGWEQGSAFVQNEAVGYADGTADLLDATPGKNNGSTVYGSAINRTMDDVVFPASGARYYFLSTQTHSSLSRPGELGFYWSGSAYIDYYGYYLYFGTSGPNPNSARHRSFACPVRCVKN